VTPEWIPVFRKEDILVDEHNYGEPPKMTTVGWLKHLFLIDFNSDYVTISQQDRKDFQKAVDILRREAKIKGWLEEWEDSTSPAVQAKMLNKVRTKLGYTRIEDDN
jgi:hypothetical protein